MYYFYDYNDTAGNFSSGYFYVDENGEIWQLTKKKDQAEWKDTLDFINDLPGVS